MKRHIMHEYTMKIQDITIIKCSPGNCSFHYYFVIIKQSNIYRKFTFLSLSLSLVHTLPEASSGGQGMCIFPKGEGHASAFVTETASLSLPSGHWTAHILLA